MSPRPLTPAGPGDVCLRMEARAADVGVVRQALTGIGCALRVGDAAVRDIAVAVGEACANVVGHAYPRGTGPLEVEAWAAGRRLVVVVRDRGPGIAPGPSRGPGLGFRLMAALSDELGLAATEPGVNEVWMAFRLTARDEAVLAS